VPVKTRHLHFSETEVMDERQSGRQVVLGFPAQTVNFKADGWRFLDGCVKGQWCGCEEVTPGDHRIDVVAPAPIIRA